MRSRAYINVRLQASTTKTCAARRGSSRPWQAIIGMADLGQAEQIGPLFAGFQNDLYVPQNPDGSPDQPPNQRPDQVAHPAFTQPPIRAEP